MHAWTHTLMNTQYTHTWACVHMNTHVHNSDVHTLMHPHMNMCTQHIYTCTHSHTLCNKIGTHMHIPTHAHTKTQAHSHINTLMHSWTNNAHTHEYTCTFIFSITFSYFPSTPLTHKFFTWIRFGWFSRQNYIYLLRWIISKAHYTVNLITTCIRTAWVHL